MLFSSHEDSSVEAVLLQPLLYLSRRVLRVIVHWNILVLRKGYQVQRVVALVSKCVHHRIKSILHKLFIFSADLCQAVTSVK